VTSPSHADLRALVLARGLRWFTGAYNLNCVAIRTLPPVLDRYADLLCVAWTDERGQERILCFPASTIPGASTFATLPNAAGAPTVAPGQYPGWTVGDHHGRPCLRPPGAIPVVRDNDRDGTPGNTRIASTSDGILVHGGSTIPTQPVGDWSEGCIVATLGALETIVTLIGCQKAAGFGSRVTVAVIEVGA
jgi:hypothetical protein